MPQVPDIIGQVTIHIVAGKRNTIHRQIGLFNGRNGLFLCNIGLSAVIAVGEDQQYPVCMVLFSGFQGIHGLNHCLV